MISTLASTTLQTDAAGDAIVIARDGRACHEDGLGSTDRQTVPSAAPGALAVRVFADLNAARLRYCGLREFAFPTTDASPGQTLEIDLLVDRADLARLERLLARHGFEHVRAWGHAPHRFHVAYDASVNCWIKLDVVDRLSFGSPARSLTTDLAAGCLERRRRVGGVYVLAPEDACLALLLHCLLDKQRFDTRHRLELTAACRAVRRVREFEHLLRAHCGAAMSWQRLRTCCAEEAWDTLLEEASAVRTRLAAPAPLRTALRGARLRLLRKLGRSLPRTRSRPLTVALLAPDGAGKSTLAAALEQGFYFPVRRVYMGLYGRESRPLVSTRLPGARLGGRVLRQWLRYAAASLHRLRGRFIVFDRYGYDALLHGHRDRGLASRWRRRLLGHACPPPDLVLLLDAPGATLHARKREHDPEILERQRQAYLDLCSRLGNCTVLDATADPAAVLREATAAIWRAYTC